MSKNSDVIVKPHATFDGKTIGDWTAAWWDWLLDAPASQDPLTDTTGAFQNVNNTLPVFFLAGTGGGTAVRGDPNPIQVPEGTPILLPLVNAASSSPTDAFFVAPHNGSTVAQITHDQLITERAITDPSTHLFASIDGVAIPEQELRTHFEKTGLFSMGPVQPGSFANHGADVGFLGTNVPVGTELGPARAEGYWLMLNGLSNVDSNGSQPGDHTLTFGFTSPGFTVSVTDYIDIVPHV
jgi:hypothetical protein